MYHVRMREVPRDTSCQYGVDSRRLAASSVLHSKVCFPWIKRRATFAYTKSALSSDEQSQRKPLDLKESVVSGATNATVLKSPLRLRTIRPKVKTPA